MGNPAKRQLRAILYDPYLDSLGGGERYFLTIAEILSQNGWQVDIAWSGDPHQIDEAKRLFSLSIDSINVVPDFFGSTQQSISSVENMSALQRICGRGHQHSTPCQKITRIIKRYFSQMKYDLTFYISDGSLPFLFSKKNLLHVQVPLPVRPAPIQRILNSFKLTLIYKVIYNSQFTSSHTPQLSGANAIVLYPPIDVDRFRDNTKEKYILSVGRFDDILNIKRQDVLIDAFKKLVDSHHPQGWKLILAGGSLQKPEYNHYLNQLQKQATSYPIEFFVKPGFDTLSELYSKATIYWHAAGFQVNQDLHPEMTEHFGMTVVEAMASGAVPIVVNRGGLTEIVTPNDTGFLWNTVDELVSTTNNLIESPSSIRDISQRCIIASKSFSKSNFEHQLLKLINSS